MNTTDRNETVAAFNSSAPNSPRVLMVSTKAGGTGLNLTIASKVIMMDFR
jgi:SNF2 family DNA or RNA helicase